ncbi:MAG: glycosyltransferase family 2 protein [Lachnospiraceae bacterium]|nr:glycosyltransferase family 2 protein [Lachnospiraceae bacterium]
MNTLISVIVPVYNTEKYLERCVKSLIQQTYRNIEIILVNDGSMDKSFEICKKLQEKYKNIILINKKNGGLSSARNAGIEVANGEYIAFLDSDDWVTQDCYEYMLNLAVTNNAEIADIMVSQVKSKDDNVLSTDEKIEVFSGRKILEHYLYRGMKEINGAPYSACRKLYQKKLFNDDTLCFVEKTVNEDICFNYRILSKCRRIAVSNQIKYFYFQGEKSISTGMLEKKDLALLKISRELVNLANESNDKRIVELAKMKEARAYFSLLARISRYGMDAAIENPNNLVKKLKKRLRKSLVLLMKSPMSITRKICAVAFCVDFSLTKTIIAVFPKFRKGF